MGYRQYSLSGETVDAMVAVLHAAEAWSKSDNDHDLMETHGALMAAVEKLPPGMRDWMPNESDRLIYSLTGDDVAAQYDAFHAGDDSTIDEHLGNPREESSFWKLTPERREQLLDGCSRDMDIEYVDSLETNVQAVLDTWQLEDVGK